MCQNNCRKAVPEESERFTTFLEYARALHCPTRWVIIRIIGDDQVSTHEIFEALQNEGESLSKSGLYYHLSELEKTGIIELAEYREAGGGAPEKVWRLKTKTLTIHLVEEET
ncbi:MAG: winged helix-turn-helix transcriptional regulator [Theionarchaea archaeon]|nr:winged helix-turn-helix transcriptional regulator [Theionarchaea archaeon]MBU7020719.1 winged helix-turn-helix transcriptional regulator [Theionarchaea archaeon]MBU7036131.1 winged helix-turn-helix transcriptional regulator [Theionarchaea archaeon]MBU7041687.1 winged helix-turn-helix transcriptional regulator [Theionarchaea archaeon]